MYEQTGCFPSQLQPPRENLPYYSSTKRPWLPVPYPAQGVLPRRQLQKDDKRRRLEDQLNGDEAAAHAGGVRESFSAIVSALAGGEPERGIVAMATRARSATCLRTVVVETWAEANGSGIFPLLTDRCRKAWPAGC
jgi:hypothetical protein